MSDEVLSDLELLKIMRDRTKVSEADLLKVMRKRVMFLNGIYVRNVDGGSEA